VKIYEVLATSTAVCLVLELCDGGETFEQFVNDLKFGELWSVDDVRFYVHQALEAVAVLHRRGIGLRDLKPENMLLCAAAVLQSFALVGTVCATSIRRKARIALSSRKSIFVRPGDERTGRVRFLKCRPSSFEKTRIDERQSRATARAHFSERGPLSNHR
jgi:serine/threonine protein kinase